MEQQRQFATYPEPGQIGSDFQTPDEFLEKFLEDLEGTRDGFDWKLVPDFGKDPDIRTEPRYRLRGVALNGTAAGEIFEPVGALCYVMTGNVFTEDHWSGAARALGLPSLCVAELIAAANDHTWEGPGGQREPVEHLQALRLRLIRAVGLRIRPSAMERVVDALIAGARPDKSS